MMNDSWNDWHWHNAVSASRAVVGSGESELARGWGWAGDAAAKQDVHCPPRGTERKASEEMQQHGNGKRPKPHVR